MPPELLAQFPLVESALEAIGVVLWPMVEFEADDALGAAAARFAEDPALTRVIILSPDKDMAQCVREDGRVATYDRRKRLLVDADGVREKFGVSPASIPDFLALVGDSSDGYPGIPGWGAVSTATVLRRYPHLEDIPESVRMWDVSVRGAATLAVALRERHEEAMLYRELALLRLDAPIPQRSVEELRWRGVPRRSFGSWWSASRPQRSRAVSLAGLTDRSLQTRDPALPARGPDQRSSARSAAWWAAGAAMMPVARVARVRSNQGPPSVEVMVAPPSAAMSPAAAMSHNDNPPHWMKASNRPLATHDMPSAELPIDRVTRTALRTASSRFANPVPGNAIEMTPSTSSRRDAWMGWSPSPGAPAEHGAEQVLAHRIEDHADGRPATDHEGHAGAEVGDARGVVDGAVKRIDDPDAVGDVEGALAPEPSTGPRPAGASE